MSRLFLAAVWFLALLGGSVPSYAVTTLNVVALEDPPGPQGIGAVLSIVGDAANLNGWTFTTGYNTFANKALSSTTASATGTLPNSNEVTETAAMNALLGSTVYAADGSDAHKTAGPAAPANANVTFTIYVKDFLIKIGNWWAFLSNTTSGPIVVNVVQNGTGAGLSHYTEFGDPLAIPLPAALPMLGAGLALLGFFGSRRKRQTAA